LTFDGFNFLGFDCRVFVKTVGLGSRLARVGLRLGLGDIYCHIVDLAQRFVDVLQVIFVNVKSRLVTHKMEYDLGHAARLAVFGSLKDDVLHLTAAKRFGALLAEHPCYSVGDVGFAAAVRSDDGRDAAAGKNDLGRIGEGLETGNFETLELKHPIVL
jgi:hypothetical protein